MKQTIFTKKGKKPGKTVAVFAGVHGNETVGITVLQHLVDTFEPDAGTLHLVLGNPRAIEAGVRFTETNLNRNFIKNNSPESYEAKRAQELMSLLDECDGLLDIHAYNEPDMQIPCFAICEESSFVAAQQLPVTAVLSGFDAMQKGGSHGYMANQEKIGIVVELGSVKNPERYTVVAETCVMNFLQYFNMTPCKQKQTYTQIFLEVAAVHHRSSKDFSLADIYASFDKVSQNQVLANEGGNTVLSPTEGRILFPRPKATKGSEAFWILREVS
jgi:succinylglutamate desuccinylase